MKVLLVEDDSLVRRVVITLLRRMYDEVDPWAAESVDEALRYLRESVETRQFDLVICDWDLLGARKGGDVLEWVRLHATHLEPRFLFLSGNEAVQSLGVRWVDKGGDVAALKHEIMCAGRGLSLAH